MKQNPRNSKNLVSLVRDANRFVLYNRGIIEASPFQLYASALVFSPRNSKIRTLFDRELPSWISTFPRVARDWSPSLLTLPVGAMVHSVAFSVDGKRLASGSRDCKVRIWDAEMGEPQKTFNGHTGAVMSVVFSPDAEGRWLASAADRTLRIWNVETGDLWKTYDHDKMVIKVAFSPSLHSKLLVSLSGIEGSNLRIWNFESGQTYHTHKYDARVS